MSSAAFPRPGVAALGSLPSDPSVEPPIDPPSNQRDPDADRVLARIGAASSELGGVRDLPLAEAVLRFDELHGQLQNALADLDQA